MSLFAIFFTKYLRMSKKSSTFAPAFEMNIKKYATLAQLVEQRIRNA